MSEGTPQPPDNRFIQLIVWNSKLLALDAAGVVWAYSEYGTFKWVKLTTTRMIEPNQEF